MNMMQKWIYCLRLNVLWRFRIWISCQSYSTQIQIVSNARDMSRMVVSFLFSFFLSFPALSFQKKGQFPIKTNRRKRSFLCIRFQLQSVFNFDLSIVGFANAIFCIYTYIHLFAARFVITLTRNDQKSLCVWCAFVGSKSIIFYGNRTTASNSNVNLLLFCLLPMLLSIQMWWNTFYMPDHLGSICLIYNTIIECLHFPYSTTIYCIQIIIE